MTELVTAAGQYLTLGLEVIALTGKTPNVKLHPTGLHSALRGAPEEPDDWALLYRFFGHPDTTGVGIVIPYPYVVVDIDGEEGARQWLDINGTDLDGCAAPDLTWSATTGRGMHLWFACFTPTGSIKLGPNLDLKGQSSYVAAPPSLHPDGRVYQWLVEPSPEAPPIEAPEALARLIEDHAYDVASSMAAKEVRQRAWGPRYKEGDTVFYAQAGHDAIMRGMANAQEGNRNNYLHWAAATLAEENGTDEEYAELEGIALAAGLDRVEVRRTLRSARRA